MQKRLQIIETVLKSVAVKLGEADMTSRFNQLGELHHNLENCLNCSDEKKETMEHLVELEAAIGEALNFLSTSKLAARFNLLKELRQELEEALAESHTTAG
jgi:F0F1-type ATP synthase delta subunit